MFEPHLRVYTVHIQPERPHAYEEAQFVQEGFSWLAFFFGPLWALYHRLWLAFFFILIIEGLLMTANVKQVLQIGTVYMLQILFHLLMGLIGHDLIRNRLWRKGYVMSGVVTGENIIRSQQRFYDRYFGLRSGAGL